MFERISYLLKQCSRSMLRQPRFFVTATLTLALAVAANVLIFQVANEVLLRPLPVSNAQSLVTLGNTWDALGYEHSSLSYPELTDYRELEVFEQVAGYRSDAFNFTQGAGDPVRLRGLEATTNFASTLGVRPRLGRDFNEVDGEQGAEPVALLTDRLFRTRFGSDEEIVESTIEIAGTSHRVVGILPPNLDFPSRQVDIWTALRVDTNNPPNRGWRNWTAYARLSDGVSVEQARQALIGNEALMRGSHDWYSSAEMGWRSSLRGLRNQLVRDTRPTLLLLLVAVGVIALVAATNVANLFLSRTSERRQELSVRTAIGASGSQLTAQLLMESMVLSSAAGVLGAALAASAGRLLLPLIETQLNLQSLSTDWRVIGFAVCLCLLLGFVIGLIAIPAALRVAQTTSLRGRAEDRGIARTRRSLVVAQLAVALALMISAGLVLRSLDRLLSTELGFSTQSAAMASVSLDRGRYPTLESQQVAFREIIDRIASEPGVDRAALTSILPLTQLSDNSIHILGSDSTPSQTAVFPQIRVVSPEIFETLNIPLVSGRLLHRNDRKGANRVAVVNAAFARKHYLGQDVVGKRFSFGLGEGSQPIEIVGVVANTQEGDLLEQLRDVYYLPFEQIDGNQGATAILVARAMDDEMAALAIRRSILAIDPLQSIFGEAPLSSLLVDASTTQRVQTSLLTGFSLIAALMAAIGIYGVLSFTMEQERKNVGLRLALGALPRQIVRMMVGRGMLLAAFGLLLGLALSLAAARAIRSQLHEVSEYDPAVFVSMTVLMLFVAMVAAWIPARRAAAVNPLAAMRED